MLLPGALPRTRTLVHSRLKSACRSWGSHSAHVGRPSGVLHVSVSNSAYTLSGPKYFLRAGQDTAENHGAMLLSKTAARR